MPIRVQGCEVVTNDRKLINLDGVGVTGIVTSLVAGTGISISGATGRVTINSSVTQADNFWAKNSTGIHTSNNVNVGIGTTTVISKFYVQEGSVTVSNTGTGTSNFYSSSLSPKTLSLTSYNSGISTADSPVIKFSRSHDLDTIKYSEEELSFNDLESLTNNGFIGIVDVANYEQWWAGVDGIYGTAYIGSGYGHGVVAISTFIGGAYESVAIGLTSKEATLPIYALGEPGLNKVELWVRNTDTTSLIALIGISTLTPPVPGNETVSNFGRSLAIENGILVIGTPDNIISGVTGPGVVFLYKTDGTYIRRINPSIGNQNSGDDFGHSVDIKNGKIVVGAPFYGGSNVGRAFVYDIDGSNEIILNPSDGATNDYFGWSVAISDQFIAVGAPNADPVSTSSGAVYVYNLDGTGERKIIPSNAGASDEFGHSVKIDKNNNLFVGAPGYGTNAGAVYRYNLIGKIKETIITPSTNYVNGDQFGYAIDVDDANMLLVGSYGDISGGIGHMYAYQIGNTLEMSYISEQPGQGTYQAEVSPQFKISTTAYDGFLFSSWSKNVNLLNIGDSVVIGSDTPSKIPSGSVFIGKTAGRSIRTANNNYDNVFIGPRAGESHCSGSRNTYVGTSANYLISCVDESVVIGAVSFASTEGISVGYSADADPQAISIGKFSKSGTGSISIGHNAQCTYINFVNCNNISIGYSAARNSTGGCNNIRLGTLVGAASSGNHNILIGQCAGHSNTGCNNIAIGCGSGQATVGLFTLTTDSNRIIIGNTGHTNFYTKMAATGSSGNAVCWNATTYELYSASSSARYKENIKPFLSGVKELIDIEPVTFNYIDRPEDPEQVGFIAEQLDEIGLTHFVNYDKESKPDSVSYDRVIVLAVNAIKELYNENQDLKLRIIQLENIVGISSGSN